MGLDSNTTAEDIEEGMMYDMYKFQNNVSKGFDWYREDMDQKSKYYLQQLTYNE